MPGCDPAPVDNLFTSVDKLRQKIFYARRRVVAVMSVGSAKIKSNERKTKMECEICDYRLALEVLQYDTDIAELEFVAVCQQCHDAIVCNELETAFPIVDIYPIAD
jgi:hypothetical protein